MGRYIRSLGKCFVLFVLLGLSVQAQGVPSSNVIQGLNWLQTQVQANGSLTDESTSIATPLQNRTEALFSLKLLATVPLSLANAIATDIEGNTEYLSRRSISLSIMGQSADAIVALIEASQNADGGFGGMPGYESDPLDTAWALNALNSTNNKNPTVILAAVNYLLASQNANGGYSVKDNNSQPYITALVHTALQESSNSPLVLDAINKINAWFLTQQKADGSWGNVAETSLSYLALISSVSDSGLLNRVLVYLNSQQSVDGSWGGDPYVTALALRALVAQPRPLPTTGDVVLHVSEGSSGLSLSGAVAAIQGLPNATATSNVNGEIKLSGIAAGNYTLTISANGYATQSLTFALQVGTTADLGLIILPVMPTSGILQGIVKDSLSGTALAGATISVTGSSTAVATTLTDGSYSITGLNPGVITVSANLSGYSSVSGTGAIVAGSALRFSPSLSALGLPTISTGSVVGQIVDATALTPLANVAVSVGTATTVTANDGRFSVNGLVPGTYPVALSFSGYLTKSISAVLVSANSATDLQTISLNKALNSISVIGRLTDIYNSQAISGGTVTVLGVGAKAITDTSGNYRIDGLASGNATFQFSAAGYTGETVTLSLQNPGEYKVDRALKSGQGSNITLSVLSSDKSHYGAYAPATIKIQVQNSGGQSVSGTVGLTIVDPQGKVLEGLSASWTDPNGVAQRQFTFPNGVTDIAVPWNTKANTPGIYTFIAKIYQSTGALSGGAVEIAARQAGLTIDAMQAIESVKLSPLPALQI